MRAPLGWSTCSLVVLLAGAAGEAAGGGPAPEPRAVWGWGAAGLVGSPREDFGDQVGTGGGVAGHALLSRPGGWAGLRLDGSFFLYGSETIRVPLIRGLDRLPTEVTTDNWTAHLVVGPQLVAPRGPVRPYVGVFGGLSYFSTTSDATGPWPLGTFASATNFDDTSYAYGAGGGLLFPLRHGRMAVDVGARYVRDGRVRFLTEGDLRDDGRGGVSFLPRHGRAGLLEVRAGISLLP
jgi:hypothetical protein